MQLNEERKISTMDPALMFLLHDSLNSNVEYLRTELVRQVALARSAQAEANRFQSMCQRGEDATKLLRNLRAEVQKSTDAVRKDLERKYADKFHNYAVQCKEEAERLHCQMQNEIMSLREEADACKVENIRLQEKNVELCSQVQELHNALVQEESQRNNLIVYIEDVLKTHNLTLSSPQRNSLSNLSASFNLITSPVKKLEFGSTPPETEKVDSLILAEKRKQGRQQEGKEKINRPDHFLESISSDTSSEIKNYPFKVASTPTEILYDNFLHDNFPSKVVDARSSADGESQKNNFLADFEILEAQQIFDELSVHMDKSYTEMPFLNPNATIPINGPVNAPQGKRYFLGFYKRTNTNNKQPEMNQGKKLSFFRNPFRRGFYI